MNTNHAMITNHVMINVEKLKTPLKWQKTKTNKQTVKEMEADQYSVKAENPKQNETTVWNK